MFKNFHSNLPFRYRELRKKYEVLAASCNKDISDEEESDEPPVEKPKVCEFVDGFGKLPFELIDEIFSYLEPMEKLDKMCVSKSWKHTIESRYLKRVMNKVVVKFDEGKYSKAEMDLIATNSRNYKHMKAYFELKVMHRFPFIDYASSLETLKINYVGSIALDYDIEAVDFIKLKKLVIKCKVTHSSYHSPCKNFMRFLKTSSFNEVTHLQMAAYNPSHVRFDDFLEKFPKLKVLHLTSKEWDDLIRSFKSSADQPKLEEICMSTFEENFLFAFKESLTEVWLDMAVDFEMLNKLLKNLHKLRSLTLWKYESDTEREGTFHRHENLQSLRIQYASKSEEFLEFLLHLPSLHTLDTYSLEKNFIEFLGESCNK